MWRENLFGFWCKYILNFSVVSQRNSLEGWWKPELYGQNSRLLLCLKTTISNCLLHLTRRLCFQEEDSGNKMCIHTGWVKITNILLLPLTMHTDQMRKTNTYIYTNAIITTCIHPHICSDIYVFTLIGHINFKYMPWKICVQKLYTFQKRWKGSDIEYCFLRGK